ncbi:MAG: hypothetical protein WA771_03415 [Chthoniobacterales bacterium]
MKATLWKELRENVKWALLGLLVLGLAEFYALSAAREDQSNPYNNLTLLDSSFLLVSSFGCSLVGIGIALAQLLPERSRDQWAAVLHRPVSRQITFLGKAIPGALLYLLATLPPLLASILYVATPGQFAAPFVPGLAIPALSDVSLGFTYYGLALLVCLDSGRWFGRRGVLAITAIPIFVLHLANPHPFLGALLGATVLLLAACGTVQSLHSLTERHPATRLALGLTVLSGAFTLIVIAATALSLIPWGQPTDARSYTRFVITHDGTVYLRTSLSDGSSTVVTDLDGNPVPDVDTDYRNTCDFVPIAWDVNLGTGAAWRAIRRSPRSLRNYLQPISTGYRDGERWYLLNDQRYFVGYDRLSRRRIGICDRNGFQPADATPRPFSELPDQSNYPFQLPTYFWVGPEAFQFDAMDRKFPKVFAAGIQRIHGIASFHPVRDSPASLGIAVGDSIHIVTAKGTPLLQTPYGHDVRTWPGIAITATPDLDRFFLKYTASAWHSNAPNPGTRLDELDATGRVVATHHGEFSDTRHAPPTWQDRLSTATLPLFPVAILSAHDSLTRTDVPNVDFYGRTQSGLLAPEGERASALITLTAIGFALGAITFAWARRLRFTVRRAAAWAGFVLAFGPAGLIAFRLLVRWPVNQPCPACRRPRPLDQPRCPHCLADWPRNARAESEIFAAT